MLLFENIGPFAMLAIIAGIFLILLFCIALTILTLLIRHQVNKMKMQLERLMPAMQTRDVRESKKKATSAGDKKGIQLDDNDIQKLKNIGVGMD